LPRQQSINRTQRGKQYNSVDDQLFWVSHNNYWAKLMIIPSIESYGLPSSYLVIDF
jgi:hypothetical protein